MKLDFKLDAWQEEVLNASGNLCICSGRRAGKSQIVAIKAGKHAAEHSKTGILIISITEDQAELMIEKILYFLEENAPKLIAKGKNRPTKHLIKLTNGSWIRTRAAGQAGSGIRGFGANILVADEAAFMSPAIWPAVTPVLLTSGGDIWLLSTPNVMDGYFFDAYTKPVMGFKTFHVNSEEVANSRPEPMRSMMLEGLTREKARMTKLQYAQEYLAQFLEELDQLFPDSLISKSQTLQRLISENSPLSPTPNPITSGEYFLGVDVARMGGDETTFEILERRENKYFQRENIMQKYTFTTETTDKILELNKIYDFIKIYIDDGGLGVAVFDQLLREDETRGKVEAINNARRSLDRDDKRKKKLLKEDLYLNLKRMMERDEIVLLDDPEIFTSLKSIIIEHTERAGEIRIYGRYSHIAEGLIRAAWAARSTHLNIYFEVNEKHG
jgi:hypothetical protein